MRYLVIVLGVLGLIVGFTAWAKAGLMYEFTVAIGVIQLGGVVLAIGMATSDIVAAIKQGPDRQGQQPPQKGGIGVRP